MGTTDSRHADRLTSRQTDRQTGRQIEGQIGRRKDKLKNVQKTV